MPDYSEILRFLAANPPQREAECKLHASLLELLANCLRADARLEEGLRPSHAAACEPLHGRIARSHIDWVHFN